MNYLAIYTRIIDSARGRSVIGYCEKHHIVPRCIGGGNEKANIVKLTAEEHFVAHQLLVKINPGHSGLALAAVKMSGGCQNNKSYGWLRRKLADALRGHTYNVGRKAGEETKRKMSMSRTGSKRTEETKKKMGAWQVGRTLSDETKKKISETKKAAPPQKRNPHTLEARKKMSVAAKGRIRTPEEIQKLRDAWKPSSTPKETAMKISAALKGRPKSPEHRAKLSAARLGTKASPETRAKIKAALAASTKRLGRPPRKAADLLQFGTVTA